ncbi:MAG TPA: DUF362 domain-containing protein [Chthoniobacterales bacterium]|jgi:hypothetical protein
MRAGFLLLLLASAAWAQVDPQKAAPGASPAEPEPTPMALPPAPVGEVFAVQNPGMITSYQADDASVKQAVDRLVIAVTKQPTAAAAWSSLVKPTDRVGLKISAAGQQYFSTHHAVVNAVVAGLQQAGISNDRIIVWDRNADDLKQAGYREKPGSYRVRWPYPGRGYAPKSIYVSSVLGQLIWGDLEFTRRYSTFELDPNEKPKDNLSSNSHYALVLANEVDKVINLPVLSAHANCGLAGALYNMTIPNIDNWRRFTSGFAQSDPAIPEMYADPIISGKVVLTIMDGLIAQFAGGPEFHPNYAVHHATLYASRDPVALDTVAIKQIDQWRVRAKMRPNETDASYLQTAREYGLGNAGAAEVKMLSSAQPADLPLVGTNR